VISVDCGKKSDKGIENKVIETRHEEEELCVIDSIPVLFPSLEMMHLMTNQADHGLNFTFFKGTLVSGNWWIFSGLFLYWFSILQCRFYRWLPLKWSPAQSIINDLPSPPLPNSSVLRIFIFSHTSHVHMLSIITIAVSCNEFWCISAHIYFTRIRNIFWIFFISKNKIHPYKK